MRPNKLNPVLHFLLFSILFTSLNCFSKTNDPCSILGKKLGKSQLEFDTFLRKLNTEPTETIFFKALGEIAYWRFWSEAKESKEGIVAALNYGLSRDEVVAIRAYAYGSGIFNGYLRVKPPNKHEEIHVQIRSETLKRALGKLPAYQGIVYRGDGLYRDRVPVPGEFWGASVFKSATTDLAIAKEFFNKGIIVEIHSKTGRYIDMFKVDRIEHEVLFAPTAVFRVKSVKKKANQYYIVVEEQ